MLVTHPKMKGFGLTPSFGDRRGYTPSQLKTKTDILHSSAAQNSNATLLSYQEQYFEIS